MIIESYKAKFIRAALNSGKATADEVAILDQALASAEGGIDVPSGIAQQAERLTGGVLGFTPVVDR